MLFLFSAKYLLRPGHLLLSGCGHIFKGIGDTELFPLIHTEGMIGQHLDALHIAERVDEGTQSAQLVLIISDPRHQHVADPHRHAQFRETAGTVEDQLIAVAGELAVRLGVDMLQVKQHRVGALHQPEELAVEGFAPCEGLPCRVEARADAAPVGFLKEADEPVDLQQSLAAADGDTSLVAPVSTVALGLVEQFTDSRGLVVFSSHAPRVGVMAITAAHVAALEKDDEADAGTVDRAERLGGVDI